MRYGDKECWNLLFEGHRFYDLKRNGLSIVKTNPAVNMPATDYRLLPRIPTSEVDGNPNWFKILDINTHKTKENEE